MEGYNIQFYKKILNLISIKDTAREGAQRRVRQKCIGIGINFFCNVYLIYIYSFVHIQEQLWKDHLIIKTCQKIHLIIQTWKHILQMVIIRMIWKSKLNFLILKINFITTS